MSERNIKLERLLFSCPEIDCQDFDTYPLVSDEDRHYMETDFFADTSCVHLYPYVRKNAAGTPFIDVYVWDQMLYPEMCRRFIICEGYRLPEEAEESLLAYLDHPFSSFGSGYEDEEEEEEEDFLDTTNTFWEFEDEDADPADILREFEDEDTDLTDILREFEDEDTDLTDILREFEDEDSDLTDILREVENEDTDPADIFRELENVDPELTDILRNLEGESPDRAPVLVPSEYLAPLDPFGHMGVDFQRAAEILGDFREENRDAFEVHRDFREENRDALEALRNIREETRDAFVAFRDPRHRRRRIELRRRAFRNRVDFFEGEIFGDEEEMNQLNEAIMQAFPGWHFPAYSSREMGKALKHAYYVSHRSGPREILYKAGLFRIAECLDHIPAYNMIGSTPASIIGHDMPLKLLRIMNQPEFVRKLFFERSMEWCSRVYWEYCDHIGKGIPTSGQWIYLETLYYNEGSFGGHGFIRALYEKLSASGSEAYLDDYKQFFVLRDSLPWLGKMKIPGTDTICDMVESLERISRYSREDSLMDPLFRERKKRSDYEYSGKDYMVVMPGSTMDLCREAVRQGNCLLDYLKKHARGETTIVFVRRKQDPDANFVTMEIRDQVIEQVFAQFNALPKKDVYEFLHEYAAKKWLIYDPYRLISEGAETSSFECDDDVLEYAEAFRERNYPPVRDLSDNRTYEQLTLAQCFPEVFKAG